MQELTKRPIADQRLVVAGIFERTRQTDDVTSIVRGLVDLAKATPDLADEVATGLEDHCYMRLSPASAVDLAGSAVPALVAVAERLRDDPDIAEDVREAARQLTVDEES